MAQPHDFDIDLRLGFIRQAQARRPRLPGNLKQLGAVGPVVRPMAANTRPAIVKVDITGGGTTGKHLSYLHAGKGIGGEDAPAVWPGDWPTSRSLCGRPSRTRTSFASWSVCPVTPAWTGRGISSASCSRWRRTWGGPLTGWRRIIMTPSTRIPIL